MSAFANTIVILNMFQDTWRLQAGAVQDERWTLNQVQGDGVHV